MTFWNEQLVREGSSLDTLTPKERSTRMGLVRGKNTKPELFIRRLVHSLGYRYRLHRRDLPGSPDLVFSSRKKVIFVHGCFWHRHPDPNCKLTRTPKSKIEFWVKKFEANQRRDAKNYKQLLAMGWSVLIVWECQTTNPTLEERIRQFLEEE